MPGRARSAHRNHPLPSFGLRERRALLHTVEATGGHYVAIEDGKLPAGMSGPNWVRRLLGDVVVIEIDFHASSLSLDNIKAQFPEADCQVVPEEVKVLPIGPY